MEIEDEGENNWRDYLKEHNMQGEGVLFKKCWGKQKNKKKTPQNKAEEKQE